MRANVVEVRVSARRSASREVTSVTLVGLTLGLVLLGCTVTWFVARFVIVSLLAVADYVASRRGRSR